VLAVADVLELGVVDELAVELGSVVELALVLGGVEERSA
jgi:hypothetical protein